jgi:adenine-specific DNA-methyltransferase
MNEDRLEALINEFSPRNLNLFLRSKCENYAEMPEKFSQYNDERFNDFHKLGEIKFDDGNRFIIVSAQVKNDLTERSGKKAQYEKARKILKDAAVFDAGFFVFSDETGSFRFSLVYGQAEGVKKSWSNFRRFTYFVNKDLTNRTFRIRVGGCTFSTLEAIKDAFSVEKVNKEFYNHIAQFFYRLTGYECKKEMTLPSVSDVDKETHQEFAVRLIGRAIFCWFLKYKKSAKGISLIPESILSSESVKQNKQYYHSTLEKLFFKVLNTPQEHRENNIFPDSDKIPFLNGGLFEPHKNDFYSGKPLYNLVIPDAWFEGFFEILEQYNFTIDENSIVDADVSVDPEMLGRIFENLLAEVNPETGETARKATGSYYTPRTIVEYMVDQSLKQYLVTKTKITEDRITALLSYETSEVAISEEEKGYIISALDGIKIIDPACGSGAFPMGILHKMLLVLQKVDPDLKIWLRNHLGSIETGIFRDRLLERIKEENWEYIRKLLIIQNSIYGVDIQTIAVEISKLRFFLSLIVDEQIDDLKNNRGVEALPNLEFKFVAANSLIGLPPVMNRQVGLGIINEEIVRLKELRNKYLRSYGTEKKRIEEDFLKTRGKLIQQNIKWGGKDALALQLANWDPFSNEASEWFDPSWMFGEDNFDIIIVNPPYLGEKGHKEIFWEIKQGTLKEYYQGKMDLFYFFFHLALNLGVLNSQIAFITTNYYTTASGATKLRKDFKDRAIIRRLINFNELKIFESALGQHNMVTVMTKNHDGYAKVDTCITSRTGIATMKIIQDILAWDDPETTYQNLTQNDLYEGDEYYIRITGSAASEADPIQHILNRVKTQGKELNQFCNINQGIISSADRVTTKHLRNNRIKAQVGDGIFVLDNEEITALEIPSSDKRILKPWFKNSDVARWHTNTSCTEYLIYADKRTHNLEGNTLKNHLLKFKSILDHSTDNSPYLHRPRDIDFCGPKIVVPQRSYQNTFAFNDVPWYASADVYFITGKDEGINLKYCLALLNSRLYYLWLYNKGKRKGEMLELYQVPLSEIPIKKISRTDQKLFTSMVDKILVITEEEDYPDNPDKQARIVEYEHQIDRMVYELYGLTSEEIAIVEGKAKYPQQLVDGIVENRKNNSTNENNNLAFVEYLEQQQIRYVDNRSKGGSLWIIGGLELQPQVNELKEKGFRFSFAPKGGRATNGKPAWYCKQAG